MACFKDLKALKAQLDSQEFEKWRPICVIVSAMGGVLTWVVCLCWWCASVGDVPVWVMCQHRLCRQRARVSCQHGWHGLCTSVGKVDSVLTWLAWLAY